MTSSHASESIARLAKRIPPGTWDTHMHVVDPPLFPLSQTAQYQPSPHTLSQARTFLTNQLGIEHLVIVQPSIYGTDNACTLDALRRLGPEKARAVVQFDPEVISQAELSDWYAIGVRGVRLNFKSVGREVRPEELRDEVLRHAHAAAHLPSWVIGLYIPMSSVPLLEPVVPLLPPGMKLCIDHFGSPDPSALCLPPHDIPGFPSLLRLLQGGGTWVKLSAGYRVSGDPRDQGLEAVCKALVRQRADRCVFATDWPHTRFEGVQVAGFVEAVMDWVEEEGVEFKTVGVDNAEVLFGR
ncbi:Amidohydrolase [Teratosphaeria destructans]|uniref:Amidohydrolase n=1 Tax=Teratosphaeria destructans TaxID=418781 RepID=A0A9W7SYI2_9PEZI|nr:Amidohydrolase [Teratosphaeria destructans]